MNKLNITLDVSKFNKAKIVEKKFKNKEGVEVTKKEYKVEAIPLKAKKFVAKGKGWDMFKTHFIVEAQTKEEKANKVDSVFVGDGFEFEKATEEKSDFQQDSVEYGDADININDIPF